MNRKLTAIILLLLMFAIKGWSQSSVNGQAYAEVIAALTAFENNQMNFGKFSPEINGGQIVLTPDGIRTTQGSVILGGGTAQSGKFTLTGQPEATYSIQLPNGPALLTNGSNNTMIVDNWVSNPPAGTGTGTLEGGTETVSIGATLNVGSLEQNPVGIYTGTYTLTFAYN